MAFSGKLSIKRCLSKFICKQFRTSLGKISARMSLYISATRPHLGVKLDMDCGLTSNGS